MAKETKDAPTVRRIMGHVDPHVLATYKEEISDERLRSVVDYVHSWLFGKKDRVKKTKI